MTKINSTHYLFARDACVVLAPRSLKDLCKSGNDANVHTKPVLNAMGMVQIPMVQRMVLSTKVEVEDAAHYHII